MGCIIHGVTKSHHWATFLRKRPKFKSQLLYLSCDFACTIRPQHPHFLKIPDSSVGKESACNAGDPGLIPGPGRSAGEGIGYPLQYCWASPVVQVVKNPPVMIPGLGRFPGDGESYPLQYFGLENSVHGVTKSQTRLRDFHFHFTTNFVAFLWEFLCHYKVLRKVLVFHTFCLWDSLRFNSWFLR